ncbi:MAG: hypothetical protein KAV87_29650 [Desulfobacteraceae bacterium]|nr:hypothetical protein [Desulfobacteraceae bacterium]
MIERYKARSKLSDRNYIFKMTPEQFMRKVAESYVSAREPMFYHPTIRRGRSHAISGLLEDLFAAFLAFNFTGHYELLVDQPITVNRSTMYPDIILVKDNKVRDLVDVKTDLGWKRIEFVQLCKETDSKLAKIGRKEGTVRDGVTKEQKVLKLLKQVRYHIVIISGQNIPKEQFRKNIDGVKKLKHIGVYVLSENQHPNVYGKSIDEIMEAMVVREDEFERLMANLTRG